MGESRVVWLDDESTVTKRQLIAGQKRLRVAKKQFIVAEQRLDYAETRLAEAEKRLDRTEKDFEEMDKRFHRADARFNQMNERADKNWTRATSGRDGMQLKHMKNKQCEHEHTNERAGEKFARTTKEGPDQPSNSCKAFQNPNDAFKKMEQRIKGMEHRLMLIDKKFGAGVGG